jgi:hypothetical protein
LGGLSWGVPLYIYSALRLGSFWKQSLAITGVMSDVQCQCICRTNNVWLWILDYQMEIVMRTPLFNPLSASCSWMPWWVDVRRMGCSSLTAHPSNIHPLKRHSTPQLSSHWYWISLDIKITLTLPVLRNNQTHYKKH